MNYCILLASVFSVRDFLSKRKLTPTVRLKSGAFQEGVTVAICKMAKAQLNQPLASKGLD